MSDGSVVLRARQVTKGFGSPSCPVVGPCDVSVHKGEVVGIVGPSGSGKTTLLQLLAGLLKPDGGGIEYLGRPLRRPTREIAIVLQDFGLFPWRTCLQNVRYPLEVARVPNREREARAMAALNAVGLAEASHRYPHQLSGGMLQRAAIARALVADPAVLLLDEPTSALDVVSKSTVHGQLLEMLTGRQVATVIVTHDLSDVVSIADRILVLAGNPGRVVAEHDVRLASDPARAVADLRDALERESLGTAAPEPLSR